MVDVEALKIWAMLRYRLIRLHHHLFSKVAFYLVIGMVVGGVAKVLYDVEFPRAAIVMNTKDAAVPLPGAYFGTLINRTRNRVCQVHSTQVIFTRQLIDGKMIDVVLPLEDTGLFWPKLGQNTLVRLARKPTDLPFKGPWFTMTVSTDECHLWDMIFGGHVRESTPVPVDLP